MYIKKIELENIQSHRHTVYEFNPTGIVRITGANNSGKSVLVKVLGALIKSELHRKSIRLPLIRRGLSYGTVRIWRDDGALLTVRLHTIPAETFVSLEHNDFKVVRFPTTDKDIGALVKLFGFHYEKESGISLNLYETYDPLLMLTTSPLVNDLVLNSVLTDEQAEVALVNLYNALKEIRALREAQVNARNTTEILLQSMKLVDEEKAASVAEDLISLTNRIDGLPHLELPELRIPINIQALVSLSAIETNCHRVPPLLEHRKRLTELGSLDLEPIQEIEPLLEKRKHLEGGTCYVCGKPFI